MNEPVPQTTDEKLKDGNKYCPFCGSEPVEYTMKFRRHVVCGCEACPASKMVCPQEHWNVRNAKT